MRPDAPTSGALGRVQTDIRAKSRPSKRRTLSEVADDAELIVAELVANAVTATRAVQWKAKNPPVRLWTLGSGDAVTILVWDATPGVPRVGNPDSDDEQGRGLMIVRELADWGFYPAPEEYGGKVIWAQLPKNST